MSNILVTQGYDGATVSANVGDTLTIELPEIPSTGYRWSPDSTGATFLLFSGDEFQLGTQSAIGGGGTHTFRFSAQQSGTGQIRCILARPWEQGSPRDTFSIQVVVQ